MYVVALVFFSLDCPFFLCMSEIKGSSAIATKYVSPDNSMGTSRYIISTFGKLAGDAVADECAKTAINFHVMRK